VHVPSDDEDALSTSVGSSDSECDVLSSDNEGENGKIAKISIADLLQRRPAVGPAPRGSLRAMPVVEHAPVSRQQFEERRWENLRNSNTTAPAKQPSKGESKPAKKSPKASPVKASPVKAVSPPVDAATAAANSARMAALLEIICPEDAPAPVPAVKSGATPPWRRQPVAEVQAAAVN